MSCCRSASLHVAGGFHERSTPHLGAFALRASGVCNATSFDVEKECTHKRVSTLSHLSVRRLHSRIECDKELVDMLRSFAAPMSGIHSVLTSLRNCSQDLCQSPHHLHQYWEQAPFRRKPSADMQGILDERDESMIRKDAFIVLSKLRRLYVIRLIVKICKRYLVVALPNPVRT